MWLPLGEVNWDIIMKGKRSTMHISPKQTATVYFCNRIALLCALLKVQNIWIINKSIPRSSEVKGFINIEPKPP
jgi:hypothetical protein